MADADYDVAEKISDNFVADLQLKMLESSPHLPTCSGSAGRAGAIGRRRATQSKELIGVKEK